MAVKNRAGGEGGSGGGTLGRAKRVGSDGAKRIGRGDIEDDLRRVQDGDIACREDLVKAG